MDWLDFKEFVKDGFKYIVFIVLVLVIIIYIASLQQIVGPSMNPTLKNNDIVILDKISYRFTGIKHNDIISFYYAETKYLVKRVIGLPGDMIEIKNNVLYVNGKVVEEFDIEDYQIADFSLSELGYSEIPQDMYFVMGDNVANSLDSRDESVGLVNRKDIIGKVFFRIWPLTKLKMF